MSNATFEFDWRQFLTDYSRELANRTQCLDWADVPHAARDDQWFGYPPATDDQISNAEQSLNITLPEDIRSFYRVTNGWMLCGHSIYDIRPVQELCWLSVGNPRLWSLCEVDTHAPEDEDDREWWYEQGIKVRRSLLLNTRGDDAYLLFDPETATSTTELRYGTWAAWNPAMNWMTATFVDFFRAERENLAQIVG